MYNNQRYFNPETWKFDTHAVDMYWKNHDLSAKEHKAEQAVSDYNYPVELVSSLDIKLPAAEKEATKQSIIWTLAEYQKAWLALREWNYSLVPNNTFPTPMKPKYLRLAS